MFSPQSYPILRSVYPNRSSSRRKLHGSDDEVSVFLDHLGRYSLGCMPMLPRESSLAYQSTWIWRLASVVAFSVNSKRYGEVCHEDLVHTTRLMSLIANASEERWPLEVKAFLLHQLLSHVIAYRPIDFFLKHPNTPVLLPVNSHGHVEIKDCCFDQEINLFGGVMAKIFVPRDGHGSAIYLFSGTTPWLCADGAGITFLDDLNPLGPGEGLRIAARTRLLPSLRHHLERLGEPAIAVGHSLGALLATYLALDLPHHVHHAVSFNPTRLSHSAEARWLALHRLVDEQRRSGSATTSAALLTKWRRLQRTNDIHYLPKLPRIDTFVSQFADDWDWASYVGARWIGNVHKVHCEHPADFIQRHVMPTGACLGGAAEVMPLDVSEANSRPWRRTRWHSVLHGAVVLPLALVVLVVLSTKRFFLGWRRGGIWSRGVLGALYATARAFFHL